MAVTAKFQADFSDFSNKVRNAESDLTSFAGAANTAGIALGAAFGTAAVATLTTFFTSLARSADELERMHDKTGISVEGLQRLRIAADDAGNSLDVVTSAITQMQRRIAGDNQSAVNALQQLGINFQEFRSLNPEQQFIAVSNAIRTVKDPADQVGLAMAILGRTGADVLPTLKRGFDDIGESSIVMSARAVGALDAMGDALKRAGRSAFAFFGEISGQVVARAIDDWTSLKILLGSLPSAPKGPVADMPKALQASTLSASELHTVYKELNDDLRHNQEEQRKAAEEQRKAAAAMARLDEQIFKSHLDNIDASRKAGEEAQNFINKSMAGQDVLLNLSVAMGTTQIAAKNLADKGLAFIGDQSVEAKHHMQELDSTLAYFDTTASRILSDIPDEIAKAFTGGGGLIGGLQSILSKTGATLFGESGPFGFGAGGALNSLGNKLAGVFGTSFGLALPGVGAALGALIGPIITGLKRLFGGPSAQELQGRDIEKQFETAMGGFQGIQKALLATGMTADQVNAKIQQLWAAEKQGGDAVKSVIDEINAALGLQASTTQDLQAAADEYGLSLANLPNQLGQDTLNQQLLELYKKEQLLTTAGFDFDEVLGKQAASFQTLIQSALETGSTIPTQLKPIIQRLIDLGLITDAAGEKLTDIGKLSFADTLDKKFETLIDSINKMVEALKHMVGGFNDAADAATRIRVPEGPGTPRANDGGGAQTSVFRPGAATATLEAGSDLTSTLRRLPEMIALAVRDAVAQAG